MKVAFLGTEAQTLRIMRPLEAQHLYIAVVAHGESLIVKLAHMTVSKGQEVRPGCGGCLTEKNRVMIKINFISFCPGQIQSLWPNST